VSSKDAGLLTGPPAAPSKYTAAVVIAVAVVAVVAVVGVVVVGSVVAVVETGVWADFVTVFVVVVPQDASRDKATAASNRPRPITRRSYVAWTTG
jgi:hypothetical protein